VSRVLKVNNALAVCVYVTGTSLAGSVTSGQFSSADMQRHAAGLLGSASVQRCMQQCCQGRREDKLKIRYFPELTSVHYICCRHKQSFRFSDEFLILARPRTQIHLSYF